MSKSTSLTRSVSRTPALVSTPTYLLSKLGTLGQRLTQRAIVDEALLLPHISVLTTLHEFGPLAQNDLAKRIGINTSHLVGYVDDLENRGAVRRERDLSDRRRQIVSMAPAGEGLLRRAQDSIDEVQERLLADLSEQQRTMLMDLLLRVLARADDLTDNDQAIS
jgi:DNA-binding MarR family transcriptional regulator